MIRRWRVAEYVLLGGIAAALASAGYFLFVTGPYLRVLLDRLLQRGLVTCGCEQALTFSAHPVMNSFIVLGGSVVALGVGLFAWHLLQSVARTLRWMRQFSVEQPIVRTDTIAGYVVHMVRSSERYIFTYGLIHPRIYISTAASANLTPAELHAVALHEIAHIRHYDIIKKHILYAFFRTVRFVPGAARLAQAMSFAQELAADQFAIARSARLTLLAALTKLARLKLADSAALLPHFAISEGRLEYLLLRPVVFPFKQLFLYTIVALALVSFGTFGATQSFLAFDQHGAVFDTQQCVDEYSLVHGLTLEGAPLDTSAYCAVFEDAPYMTQALWLDPTSSGLTVLTGSTILNSRFNY